MGTGFSFDVDIRLGAGAFVCGEETALLTSVEGKRGEPRPRPPFPAEKGLWGVPTFVNNVETLANIPVIFTKGGDWFSSIGTAGSKGTKVFAMANPPEPIMEPAATSVSKSISVSSALAGRQPPEGPPVCALEILDKITRGEGTMEDIDNLETLARTISSSALCALGQTAPNPILATLKFFRDEYDRIYIFQYKYRI